MKEILISTREIVNNNPPDWIDTPTLTEEEFVDLVAFSLCEEEFGKEMTKTFKETNTRYWQDKVNKAEYILRVLTNRGNKKCRIKEESLPKSCKHCKFCDIKDDDFAMCKAHGLSPIMLLLKDRRPSFCPLDNKLKKK